MGKTIRNYNGDGLKSMKKITPKKKNTRVRDFIDEDEDDFYDSSYQSDQDDQSDSD